MDVMEWYTWKSSEKGEKLDISRAGKVESQQGENEKVC